MHRQPSRPGLTRRPTHSSVDRRVRAQVEHTANRFNVSKSWVIAEILADFFGIDYPKSFEEAKRRKEERAKGKKRR